MARQRKITTIREQVYSILREDICGGKYQPGTRLQEVELAESLNVSRSPVREALRQLVYDGLLFEIPNKGVYVKEFTAKDIDEIYDMRVLLECYGIQHCKGKITSTRLERLLRIQSEMESTFERRDLEAYTACDEKLHVQLVRLADNSLINDTYERVRSMNQQFRVLALMDEKRFAESLDEHRTIIQSIITGDLQTAIDVDRHHLDLARDAIRSRMLQEE